MSGRVAPFTLLQNAKEGNTVTPEEELYCQTHCQRCGLHRSLHNPDVYHPHIKMDGKPLYCEGFIPIDPTLDAWAEDKKWVHAKLAAYLEREHKK